MGKHHWSERSAAPEVFASGNPTRRGERQRVTKVLNQVLAHYGLKLADWGATQYVLSGPTGRTELVGNLAQVWPAAERLCGRGCDPLDKDLLSTLRPGPPSR